MWMFPFKVMDILVVVAGMSCVVALLTKYYSTYEVEKDNFGIQLFDRWNLLPKDGSFRLRPLAAASFLYIVAGCVALVWSFFRTSGVYNSYTCFNEAMSAVALLPQLWMFQHDKRVDSQLASFVVMIAVNRLHSDVLDFLAVLNQAQLGNSHEPLNTDGIGGLEFAHPGRLLVLLDEGQTPRREGHHFAVFRLWGIITMTPSKVVSPLAMVRARGP